MAAVKARTMEGSSKLTRMREILGSSCPRLQPSLRRLRKLACAASTSLGLGNIEDVDGRDKPGHDGESVSSVTLLDRRDLRRTEPHRSAATYGSRRSSCRPGSRSPIAPPSSSPARAVLRAHQAQARA